MKKRIIYSRLSIRQRLPLLIFILLLSVILIFGVISYVGVRKATLKAGQERLQTLSQQLSIMLSNSTHNAISTTHAAANKPAVKTYLLSEGRDSALEVKKLLKDMQKDTSYVRIELRNSNRVEVLNSSIQGINIDISLDSLLLSATRPKIDSGGFGKIYAIGDSIFYPIMATITRENELLGYLIKWRKMQGNSKSVTQLSQLLGSDAKLLIGNTNGSLWTDMIKPVPPPPFAQSKNQIIEYTGLRNNKKLASIHPISSSPWLISVEFPKFKVLQTVNTFLYWLIVAGLCLLVVGIFFGWLMSRNISRPLAQLTKATSEIAAGKYSSPVLVNRRDELGKLARSFNAMTVQVRNSQKELEQKANSYELLFEKNPLPMWILLKSTLEVTDVNAATLRHYGYTREEFLKLTSLDLRPEEDIEKYLQYVSKGKDGSKHGIWRHKKKDGTIIMVDVIADEIMYNGKEARLVLANDVTEKLKAEAELISHRIMQQELITETTLQVQEKEREELGKELHDNINQILTSTKLYLELAQGDSKFYTDAVSKSYENINLAIGEIRQLSKQLVPPSLDTSLIDTLKDLTQEIQAITPITVTFKPEKFDENFLDDNLKLMIYRIVQEQINNILKHAAASMIEISIGTDSENVFLKIEDNGVGFDISKKSKGIGLRNIDNRVKFHKGKVNIYSRPGEGCRVEISVPLKSQFQMAF